MEQTFIQVRVDANLKNQATDILEELGLDMPNAIRMFLKRIVAVRGLPFDAKLPDLEEAKARAAQNRERREIKVEYIPASPCVHLDYIEYVKALQLVPYGKLTRYEDVLDYLAKLHNAPRVELLGPRPLIDAYDKKYPYWRVVSSRGFLQEDRFLLAIGDQKEMLESEGHKIIPGGAGGKSLKVENYREALFDFSKAE